MGVSINVTQDDTYYTVYIQIIGGPYQGRVEKVSFPIAYGQNDLESITVTAAMRAAQPLVLASYQIYSALDACASPISCDFAEPLKIYDKSLEEPYKEDHQWALLGKAYISWITLKYEEAIEFTRCATRLDPGFAQAYLYRGLILNDQGHYREAIDQFKDTARLDRRIAQTYRAWGYALQRQGYTREAMQQYEKAISLSPNSASTYRQWGEALAELGQTKEAAEKFEKATDFDPTDARTFQLLADQLQRLGRKEEAHRYVNRATQLGHARMSARQLIEKLD